MFLCLSPVSPQYILKRVTPTFNQRLQNVQLAYSTEEQAVQL